MTVLERIKALCREKKNISITTLEQILGYSNGSLSKAKDIPASRILAIAMFFNVSTDYILTGKEPKLSVSNTEIDTDLVFLDRKIKEYALKMSKLSDAKLDAIFTLIDAYERKER